MAQELRLVPRDPNYINPYRKKAKKEVCATLSLMDLFTDTAAILNQFDLRSIIGCPGGVSTFRLYFRALFGTFFLEVFLE